MRLPSWLSWIGARWSGGPPPLVAFRTPPEVAAAYTLERSWYIGRRRRRTGCTGVAWLDNSRLLVLNLPGHRLDAYNVDAAARTVLPVEQPALPGLDQPENMGLSPDRRVLAITNAQGGKTAFFRVDADRRLVNPEPLHEFADPRDRNHHAVCFTDRCLYHSTVDKPGFIRCFEWTLSADGRFTLSLLQELVNERGPKLRAKGLGASPCGRFLAVTYGPGAGRRARRTQSGELALFRLEDDGRIHAAPADCSGDHMRVHCGEDVNFFPDGNALVMTDQGLDRATILGFDSATGRFTGVQSAWYGHRSRLRFPHGCAISPDGTLLAVANYGTDSFNVYACETG